VIVLTPLLGEKKCRDHVVEGGRGEKRPGKQPIITIFMTFPLFGQTMKRRRKKKTACKAGEAMWDCDWLYLALCSKRRAKRHCMGRKEKEKKKKKKKGRRTQTSGPRICSLLIFRGGGRKGGGKKREKEKSREEAGLPRLPRHPSFGQQTGQQGGKRRGGKKKKEKKGNRCRILPPGLPSHCLRQIKGGREKKRKKAMPSKKRRRPASNRP